MALTISLFVENKSGVLARVAGVMAARGFNIDSLTVAKAIDPGFSLMTVVVDVEERLVEQVIKQLGKLINVITVTNLSEAPSVEREMALVKVSLPDEMRPRLLQEAEIFRARVVDSSPGCYTLEATGDSDKLEAFLRVIEAYGRLEVVRTGAVAMLRGLPKASSARNGGSKAVAGGPILI
jgi:acetolactate synthase-1/3 small subunit